MNLYLWMKVQVVSTWNNSSRYSEVTFSVITEVDLAQIQRSRYARYIDGIQDMALASVEEPLRTLKQHMTSCVK